MREKGIKIVVMKQTKEQENDYRRKKVTALENWRVGEKKEEKEKIIQEYLLHTEIYNTALKDENVLFVKCNIWDRAS